LSSTSRVPALIDYLVTAFTAAPTLGAATPPVSVFDGPPTTADPAPLALHVGMDDLFSDQAPTSATSDQIRQGLAQKRQETVTVHCAAVAWAGTDDMRTVRQSAFAILAAAEDIIRLNNDGFGGNAGAALPGVSGIALQQNNTAQGAVAQVTFQVTFISFIGS
jgi:hypothetical protein